MWIEYDEDPLSGWLRYTISKSIYPLKDWLNGNIWILTQDKLLGRIDKIGSKK